MEEEEEGGADGKSKYLSQTKGLNHSLTNKTVIISNVGAVVGGTIAGYVSQYAGRRLCAIFLLILTAAVIPAWILPTSFAGLAAGGL